MHLNAKPGLEFVLQIGPPPAHHAVNGRIRTLFNKLRKGLLHLRRQRALEIVAPALPQALNAFAIVAVNPVPQRLPVHAAGFRRASPVHSIQHQRNRQYPADNQRVLLLRRLSKPRRAQVKPRYLHCSRHR